ncbi:Uncharacterised protein [Mycobacteroides abscessus subsp. abscessus]|nr:Uncharacterised protein [Mycobacteroides abscessus subsp. abscessus]
MRWPRLSCSTIRDDWNGWTALAHWFRWRSRTARDGITDAFPAG